MLIAAEPVTMADAGDQQGTARGVAEQAAALERQRQLAVAEFLRRSQLNAITPLPGAMPHEVRDRRRARTDR